MSERLLPFQRDNHDTVTLTLDQPGRPVVVLDRELLETIDRTLDQILVDGPPPGGLVLASCSKVFVAGANLREIMDLSDTDLEAYLAFGSAVFARFANIATPTVAAINGAALGGGLELAMHCDHLIAAHPNPDKPYHIGLPEAGLSICPGWGGTNLLPARMADAARAITMTATGKTVPANTAHELGIVSRLVSETDLLDVARDIARSATPRQSDLPIWIGDNEHRNRVADAIESVELPGTGPATATRAAIKLGLEKSWPAALASERASLIALRSAPEGAAAINAFFEKSAKPKTTNA